MSISSAGEHTVEASRSGFWRACHWSDWIVAAWGITAVWMILARSPGWALLLLPAFTHGVLVFVGFMLRGRAQQTQPAWRAKIVAYGASFLVVTFIQVAVTWRPDWLAPSATEEIRALGAGLYLTGISFGLWSLWWLRRSFSIEAAARRPVTDGPYRFARHSIDTMYFLQYLGLWLTHLTLAFTVVVTAWWTLMLLRIRYEEAVLTAVFPEYSAYRGSVGAFGPRLRRVAVPLSGPSGSAL